MVSVALAPRGQRAVLLCLGWSVVPVALAGPCDIYAAAGTPCAASHSVVRALHSAYSGPLYQLKRFHSTSNASIDIHPLGPGGVADARAHDVFCSSVGTTEASDDYPVRAGCVVWQIYDQTGNGNHLLPAGPAVANPGFDLPVNATRHTISIAGHKAYGAYFETGMGYRAQNTTQVARANEPETVYMVTSGTHVNNMCCFDYGNSENDCTDRKQYVDGAMEAVYFGTGYGGSGKGPWIGADMENGIYGGKYVEDSSLRSAFVTAMIKGRTDGFATKGGDATAGKLTKYFDGPRPDGYQPMRKTGAIILGVGGDNAARVGHLELGVPGLSVGTFYEGVLTVGVTTDAADDAVQADIVAAGYGRELSAVV